MTSIRSLVSLVLLLAVSVTGIGIPVAQAAEAQGSGSVVSRMVPENPGQNKGGDVQPDNIGSIIRAILIGAMALWRSPFFRKWAIDTTRNMMGSAVAVAVETNWDKLYRTVQNLIGMDRLSWTIVSDNFLRTLMNNGVDRPTATNGALALREFLKSLANYFH